MTGAGASRNGQCSNRCDCSGGSGSCCGGGGGRGGRGSSSGGCGGGGGGCGSCQRFLRGADVAAGSDGLGSPRERHRALSTRLAVIPRIRSL